LPITGECGGFLTLGRMETANCVSAAVTVIRCWSCSVNDPASLAGEQMDSIEMLYRYGWPHRTVICSLQDSAALMTNLYTKGRLRAVHIK